MHAHTGDMEGPVVTTTIRVSIVEDQREMREGLAQLIEGADGFACNGAFRSMEEAIVGIDRALPDVALVDIGLPGMSGIDGIRILKERHPGVQFLILTVYDDDERIFDALCAGATGYLLKKTRPTGCSAPCTRRWKAARRCRPKSRDA